MSINTMQINASTTICGIKEFPCLLLLIQNENTIQLQPWLISDAAKPLM